MGLGAKGLVKGWNQPGWLQMLFRFENMKVEISFSFFFKAELYMVRNDPPIWEECNPFTSHRVTQSHLGSSYHGSKENCNFADPFFGQSQVNSYFIVGCSYSHYILYTNICNIYIYNSENDSENVLTKSLVLYMVLSNNRDTPQMFMAFTIMFPIDLAVSLGVPHSQTHLKNH